jgi:hypothetical protein
LWRAPQLKTLGATLSNQETEEVRLELSWYRFGTALVVFVVPLFYVLVWLVSDGTGLQEASALIFAFVSVIIFISYRFCITKKAGLKVKVKGGVVDPKELALAIAGGRDLVWRWSIGTGLVVLAIILVQ